jgi:hypothetical protein
MAAAVIGLLAWLDSKSLQASILRKKACACVHRAISPPALCAASQSTGALLHVHTNGTIGSAAPLSFEDDIQDQSGTLTCLSSGRCGFIRDYDGNESGTFYNGACIKQVPLVTAASLPPSPCLSL